MARVGNHRSKPSVQSEYGQSPDSDFRPDPDENDTQRGSADTINSFDAKGIQKETAQSNAIGRIHHASRPSGREYTRKELKSAFQVDSGAE